MALLLQLAAIPLVFLGATIAFDVVHWALHRLEHSQRPLARAIGGLHGTHHRWFDERLHHDDGLGSLNLLHHVVPEYLTHSAVSFVLLGVLPMHVVAPVWLLQSAVFASILAAAGKDVNHRARDRVRAYRPLYFCVPAYHQLHHLHPDAHFSSWIKTFDHLAGSGLSLTNRRVLVLGAEDAMVAALADLLDARGAGCTRSTGRTAPSDPLDADTLLVAAEVPDAVACEAVERLCARAQDHLAPPEVWRVVGSSASGATARYWRDPRVIYRHVAVGALSPAASARRALRLLRSGFNFAPACALPRVPAAYGSFRTSLA